MRRRLLAGAAGVLMVGGLAAPFAAAQASGGDRLVLRAVDASDREATKLVVSYGGSEDDLDELTVAVDGEEIDTEPATLADTGLTNDIVFVVDASESTDDNALLTEAREAVRGFVSDLPDGTRAAIVSGSSVAQTHQRLTADRALLDESLGDFAASGRGGVLDAVVLAAGLIDDDAIGTVVLLTDGMPEETLTLDVVRGELVEAGTVFHAVGLNDEGFDAGPLNDLANATDGSVTVFDNAGDVAGAFDALVPELTQVRAVSFAIDEDTRGILDLAVSAGDSAVEGSFVAGGNLLGPNRLEPRPGVEPSGPSFLRGSGGRYLAYGGALVAGILFAFGMGSVLVREDTGLHAALQPYSDSYVAEGEDSDEIGDGAGQPAFLRRAVEATESFADRQGFLTRVEHTLEKADIPLRAGEAMFFYAAAVLLVAVAALTLSRNLLAVVIVAGFVALIGPAVVNFRASRKKKKFESLLPDTLQLLSSTLRAGYSMMQGVEAVSQEAEEPMGKELRRVVTEARLGRPLEESLDGIAERMDSADFAWAVMAIRIQREVGGNLSELLMTVAETMTERERLRRDINSLTAEGRMSAYVLGLLPIGLGGAIMVINPEYMGKLFDETLGQILLGAAIVMMAVGFAWMSKIIKIDI